MKATVIGLNPAISRNNKARQAQAAALSASARMREERERELETAAAARERAKELSRQIREIEREAFDRFAGGK